MRLDRMTVSVAIHRLEAVCKEMGAALIRSAHSPILAENRDLTTALFTADGRLISQMSYAPILLGSLPDTMASFLAAHEVLSPGDVLVVNDPRFGNNHLPDIVVARPHFEDGELAYWLVAKGHHADLGGSTVGGYNPAARTAWEEGFRIPPMHLYRQGRRCPETWALLRANIRQHTLVENDLEAQVGSTQIGARSLAAAVARFGRSTLNAVIDEALLRGQQETRAIVGRLRPGEYAAERSLDIADEDGEPVVVAVTVRVTDREIDFDFTGTTRELASYHNSPLTNTRASCFLAFFAMLAPRVSINAGTLTPLRVTAPSGCLVNPGPDAATGICTTVTTPAIVEGIWIALARADSGHAMAGWARRATGTISSGTDPRTGRSFAVIHHFAKGGSGATYGHDGWDHIGPPTSMGASRSPDPELFEMTSPHELVRFEYREESPGHGRWRGGYGVRYHVRFTSDTTSMVIEPAGGSPETAPAGVLGGGSGKTATARIIHPDGTVLRPTKSMIYRTRTGDVLELETSGGGGCGDPLERSEELVSADVADGLLSPVAARTHYGVVIGEDGVVDEPATRQLRGARRDA